MSKEQAIKALYDYAVSYEKGTFSTSWESYSVVESEPEKLINAVLEAFEAHAVDYIPFVTNTLVNACEFYSTERQQVQRVAVFISDMFANLTEMSIQETRGFAEDEE